ncbi:hypothetical protein Godav_010165 [Gossypium davidsonii]|uniref:Uncharacterized protein n=1 Tax=Gossypium davidsonii TaxID=34287 RepID=A0A7J8SFM0_GOSDV|nr:hypothetical protein [Gossypium davidsonii]
MVIFLMPKRLIKPLLLGRVLLLLRWLSRMVSVGKLEMDDLILASFLGVWGMSSSLEMSKLRLSEMALIRDVLDVEL